MGGGIYAIVNTESGKVYVGATARSFKERWAEHRKRLRGGYHDNSHLNRAWKKYGAAAFEFVVLEGVEDPDCLIECEQYWLDEYRMAGLVYNTGVVAGAHRLGCSHTEETKRKLSEIFKGRPRGPRSAETRRKIGESKAKLYPAFVHRETGEIIPAGCNLTAMCRERGLRRRSMCRVANRRRRSHKGWVLAADGCGGM